MWLEYYDKATAERLAAKRRLVPRPHARELKKLSTDRDLARSC